MSDSPFPTLPADVAHPTGFLHALLTMSLTAVAVLRPLYAADSQIIRDFAWVSLNPAGQRMIGQPAQPAGSLLTLFPTAQTDGVFEVCCRAFATGEPGRNQTNYQADGLDGYFVLVAQRYDNVLVVNFTDTNDQPRSAVEVALRESQAAERAARAEAERQRQRFYDLLMQLPAQVAVHEGPDQVFTLVNPGYQRLAPGRTLQGQSIREAWPELVSQGILDVLDQVYRTGEPFIGKEVPLQVDFTRTGHLEQVYLNAFFLPLRDEQGRVSGVLDFSIDVTEPVLTRRHAEQLTVEAQAARQQAEAERQRLTQVLMRMPANVALLRGPEHVYDLVNAEYERLFPARNPLGRPLREVIPELAGQGFYELFDRVYATGEPFYLAEAEAWADFAGTGALQRRYYRTAFEPIRDAQGRVTEVLNFAVDVTAHVEGRQQVEQLNAELEARVQQRTAALQESEQRFRTMADAAPAMLWVTDPDGQCTYLNAQWYQYTGQTEAEALGMGWTRAVHPNDVEQAGQQFLDANARRVPFSLRYRLRRHDGVYRWAVDAGRPHFTEDGTYAGIVGTVIDSHEQQLAENELHAANEQLRRTNVDLDNFIYTASHDLKAPITNIEGLLLALEHELPAAERPGDVSLMLTMMQDAIERFRRTITHLTDLSRLQKEHSPEADGVLLAPVVEAVRLDLTPLLAHTQGQLTVSIADNLLVTFAEKNLRSVVYNLLSNAFKYHHPDRVPAVQLRGWLADEYVVLEVQDNGLGLDLSRGREQLFGMFQRLHTHVEGSGVGLYMVKRILENAGGRIEVASKLGEGTTFSVFFRR